MKFNTTNRATTLLRATAGALVLGMLLSGCTEVEETDEATPYTSFTSGSEAERQAEEFASFYDQEVLWYECEDYDGLDEETADALAEVGYPLEEIACGIVSAPLNWNTPESSESIELNISWLPALGDGAAIGALFTNPGGPGEAGTDFAFATALSENIESVITHYDIVGMDPRGVGGSTPIDCATDYVGDPEMGLAECAENNPLAASMGTEQVARDLEMLRYLLGDPQFNYMGVSYGTMLGATYAQLFPELVGRMVLDSAESAGWASLIHSFDQQVEISEATIELALTCTTDFEGWVEVCPFVDEASLTQVVQGLNADPLLGSDGAQLNGTDLAWYLSSLLYEWPEDQASGLDLLSLALFGDQAAIDELVSMWGGSTTDLVWKTIMCHSAPPEQDLAAVQQHIAEVGLPGMWGGPELTDETLAPLLDTSCEGLPEHGGEFVEAYVAPTENPLLVLGMTGDHATPFHHGQRFAAELGNAVFVTLDEFGHGASYAGRSSCIDEITTAYLVDGVLPPEGTVCRDD